MAEWLTHVLLAYALFTALGWVVEFVDGKWVAVGLVGAVLPDLNRFELLVPSERITGATGVAFHWNGIHTVGGVVALCGVGALLFGTRTRKRRAFLLLLAGAASHLLVDLPQQYADGRMLTNLYLFPLPPWRPPTPGWYVPSDRWTLLAAALVALLVVAVDAVRSDSAGA